MLPAARVHLRYGLSMVCGVLVRNFSSTIKEAFANHPPVRLLFLPINVSVLIMISEVID